MNSELTSDTRKTRTNRVSKEQILDAALALVLDGGVSAVSLRKIAARIDCAAPTIYYYFRGKQDILEELWSRQIDQVLEHSAGYQSLEESLYHYGHYWMVHRSLFQLMFLNNGVQVEELDGYIKLSRRIEMRFQQKGIGVEDSIRRCRMVLSAIHGLVLSSVHQHMDSPEAEIVLKQTIHLMAA